MSKRAPRTSFRQPYRYASPDIPLKAIRSFARRIAARFRPEKIILFGSYAYGTPHAESDVDLLVIMPTRNTIDQAIRIDLSFERWFSLDLIVRTPWQVERGLKDDNWFLREVIDKGRVLYESRNCKMDSQGGKRLGGRKHAREERRSATRRRLLPLSASRGEVSQGIPTGKRAGRAANARP
jgi:predicted nucleotidyltransferase